MASADCSLNHFIFHSVFKGPDEDPTVVKTCGDIGHNMLNAILTFWTDSTTNILDAVEKAEKEEICFLLPHWIYLIVQRWISE